MIGARITRIAVYNSALSMEDLAKVTGEDEPEEDDVWGNVGNATDGGIATKADNGNYSNTWTINFTNTTNICTKEIGCDGEVTIKQIKMAKRLSDNKDTKTPSKLTLTQGDVSIESTALEFVENGISAYTSTGAVVVNGTRTAYVFTFDGTTKFDTTKDITLSFNTNNVGLGMMQPANPLFQSSNYSPMIEITGDYTSRIVGPVITKDEKNHTWVVDTTYGAYAFTSAEITELKNTAWKVTLKSRSELGATVNFGSQTSQQLSHFVIESGMLNLTWLGGAENINFNKTGTADDPSILVKSGAVLNFTAKDITGWKGAATDKKGNVIRVNEGGVLNLLQSNDNTHYYQGRYWLDSGATLTAMYSDGLFRMNGGAVEGSEQLYVPNTTNGAPAATLFAANGLYLHTDETKGLGIYVGANATLNLDAAITSKDTAEPISKWGAGTLALNESLTGYSGALTVNAGALKLPQETTLGGSLTLAANTVLDIAYDGLPSKGTAIFTATRGITIGEDAIIRINGDECVYDIVDNAIVFDHIVVVVPAKSFTYEPKVNAKPTGWITSFGSNQEPFTAAGQFRVGPDGECVSVVSSGQYPWYNLDGKANYTMALYADISQIAYDKTGRFLVELGGKGNGINQGILMTQDGNVRLFQANKSTVQYTLTTTNAPAAGYHLFVWTQSTENGGALYVDGVRVGTIPEMTSATSKGFQLGSMHGGPWDNYGQGIGMAVAGVYGWGQVLSPAQVALLAEQYPPVTGGITVKSVDPNITGTLNLVYGNVITSGVYDCSIAIAYGATIDIAYEGEVKEGVQLLEAKSISADAVTFTVNGQPLPSGLDMDAADGKLVVCKQKVTKLLNPLAVKEGDDLKVSCNEEAPVSEAAKAYDGNLATYFNPGAVANSNGVSWTGIEFTNSVIVTRIAYVSNKEKRVIGGAFQGANEPDFSDAENIYVVAEYTNGGVDVTLDEAKGPYKYLRFMGMYGGEIKEIAYYGLADSGALAPAKAPTITGTSSNGVAQVTVTADETIPQLFIVQRAMRNFCDPDGSDYETCVTLAPQLGETMTWTDRKVTGYAMYRAKGFNANGSSDWAYFEIEPEKLINGPAAPSFKGNKPGFYDETASVEIEYGLPGATIYYTTDGSTPTTSSTPYTGAITLVDVSESMTNDLVNIRPNPTQVTDSGYKWIKPTANQPNVNVIRARAFLPDGSASSNDVAGTWMVGPTANAHKLRVISIQTDRDNYFSDPTGILVPGDVYKQKGWPGGTVGSPNANYFQHGDDWERPAQIEVFDTDRTEMLSAPIGTRIRGNWSRAAAKKSLTCYFRKEYGVKNAKIKLFNDEGKMKFKRFIVRNGGNDWFKFGYRDAIGQSIFRGYVSTGTQGFEPGVLYINGEYWGLYNLRHCYSKHHFEEWNGSVGDDIDYVKMSPDDGNHFEVQEGDLCAMWDIMQYMITCTADGVMDDDEYAYVSSQIDIADMIDYYIVNVFLGNSDWNGNNMGYWRNRHGDDQKWHFTVYDCDSAMAFDGNSSYSADHIQRALGANDTDESQSRMVPGFFKRCFKNEGFRKRFANRYADLLNTALTAERATNVVAEVAAKVSHELPRNIDRWLNIGSGTNWSNELATVNKFFYKRQENVFGHIKSHCNGGSLASITLTNSVGNGTVKLNTIESGKEFELPFTGTYFANIPVTLTATPDSGSEFAGWKIGDEVISTEPTMTLTPTNGVTIQAVFEEAGASEQEKYLRLWGFCGAPLTGGSDGPGEFIILTNLNASAALDLEGAYLNICKYKDDFSTSPCQITFPAGSKIEAGGYLRIEKKDGLQVWTKIQDGDLKIQLLANNGATIYELTELLSQESKGVKGKDKFLKAIAYNQVPDDWEAHDNSEAPVKPEPPGPTPGGEVISGDYPDGTNIVLTADATIKIGNATFGKALTITGGNASIEMQPGTTAKIPTIEASGLNLTFGGTGTLSMSNATTLITCGDLIVTNGTLAIDFQGGAFEKSAVYLTGNFKQLGGDIALNVASANAVYGIQINEKNMEAYFEGGTFTPVLAGGEKSAVIKLNKGSSHANLKGGETVVTMSGPTNRFVNTDGKVKISGTYRAKVTSTGLDARVFKATKEITIKGGTVTGEATGAGSEMFSTDTYLEMTDGVAGITAAEDGISAKGDVQIKGGKLQILSTGGDAIDSNGNIAISGGYVLANATAEGCYGIEVEAGQQLVISGGTVVAVGYENVIHLPDAGSVGCYTSNSVKYDKDNKYIEVAGTNAVNKLICTVNLKDKCAKKFSLIATCPGFLGTVSYTGTKPDTKQSYIEKLDENLDGAFLTLLDRVEPGKATEMEAKTEEEAQKEIKKYEVVLTEEDIQAGVEPNMLKMVPQPVTNEVGAVTYYAVVAVNPEVVPAPTVGEDETGEVKPIVVTPTAGGTEVSVGIVNATKGLWYGYEVCDALKDGFLNDVPSFARATGEAITIKGTKRTGSSSFFRVKVLPAQPH